MGLDKKTQPNPSQKQTSENARLRKENTRLQKENDLLLKWQRYLAEVKGIDSASSNDTDQN